LAEEHYPGKLVFFKRRFIGALRPLEFTTPILVPVGIFSGDLPNGDAEETAPVLEVFASDAVVATETTPTYEFLDGVGGAATETNPTYTTELNP
jgi:hypothetical protein